MELGDAMSKAEISSIVSVDPFDEKYGRLCEKRERLYYLEVYKQIFDSFPLLFQKLSRQYLDSYYRRIAEALLDPANILDANTLVSNWSKLMHLACGAVRGGLLYWQDERVKLGLREPSNLFRIGENIASTPSETVYESELLELKRYLPAGKVHRTPMVMFYSWINGYWILDLDDELSLMRHLRDRGIDAYITNWKIPKSDRGRLATLDDYLAEGKAALDVVSELTGQERLGICGYCIGGVISDILAALFPDRTAYMVNLTTGLDTMAGEEGAGPFGAFTNFEIAKLGEFLEKHGGIFPKKEFEEFFDNVKPKRAVDSFFHRYVYGEEDEMDPVTYWNRKSAKEIYPVHTEFLLRIYNNNELAEGRMTVLGRNVDLSRITAPVQIIIAQYDHIVPMPCALRTAYLVGTPKEEIEVRLVRGGHVRAIANRELMPIISEFISKHSGEAVDRPAFGLVNRA